MKTQWQCCELYFCFAAFSGSFLILCVCVCVCVDMPRWLIFYWSTIQMFSGHQVLPLRCVGECVTFSPQTFIWLNTRYFISFYLVNKSTSTVFKINFMYFITEFWERVLPSLIEHLKGPTTSLFVYCRPLCKMDLINLGTTSNLMYVDYTTITLSQSVYKKKTSPVCVSHLCHYSGK